MRWAERGFGGEQSRRRRKTLGGGTGGIVVVVVVEGFFECLGVGFLDSRRRNVGRFGRARAKDFLSLSRWAKTSASHKNFGSPGKFQSTNMECVQNTDGCRIGVLISAPQPGTRR